MTATIHLSSVTRLPVRSTRRSLLLIGAAATLIAVGPRLAAPVEGAHAVSPPASVAASAPAPTGRPSCWVTGDLVGEANPAAVAAALCGHQ